MSGRRSRTKGASGEREVVQAIGDTWPDARRGYQRRQGNDEPDVQGTPYWIEVKRVKKQERIRAAMEQAEADTDGRVPVVWSRCDQKGWLVTMRAENWLELMK